MSLIIRRTSRITTAIELTEANLSRLKDDLEANEYLEEMDDFETFEELAAIVENDPNAATLVFEVLINSPGYAAPSESFSDDSVFSATYN
jgi:N-glycosylase/DNA lyase